MSKTRIYNTWNKMIERCHNQNCPGFPNYGGRGIRVCKRWRDSFDAFYADVGMKPSPRHSLERINNDGDYKPNNVRWATPREQLRNTRCTRWLTFRGERRSMIEWSELLGIPYRPLKLRIRKGWDTERALTTPVRFKNPNGMGRRKPRHVA